MEGSSNQLLNIFLCLLAVVLAVPGARKIGFGPVPGYLVAGVLIGPWGLALIREAEDIRLLADFSMVVMLFLVGFELQPSLLRRVWREAILKGVSQWVIAALLLLMVGLTAGLQWREALAIALALSLSSIALPRYFMREKNLSGTERGDTILALLVAQSVLLFPLLIMVPLLGFGVTVDEAGWVQVAKVLLVSAVVFFGGRLVQQHVLRYLSATQLPDMFSAFSLLLVTGIVLLMHSIGSNMLVGAYIAGCLMAGSEFRRELESSIQPFRGLLIGLFFVSLGLLVDFGLLLQYPHIVLAVLLTLVTIKGAAVIIVGYFNAESKGQRWLPAVLLAPAGETAFVILGVAMSAQALDTELGSGMVVVVALSMLITPVLQVFYNRRVVQAFADDYSMSAQPSGDHDPADASLEARPAPVVIAGFGRMGQVVARLLMSAGIKASIIDYDPLRLDEIKRFGFSFYCGDVMRLELLKLAGLGQARVLVIAVDDWQRITRLTELVRLHFPAVSIVARSRDRLHQIELMHSGVHNAHRETFESALLMGEDTLNAVGIEMDETERISEAFRDHDERLLFQDIEGLDKPDSGDNAEYWARQALWQSSRRRSREALEDLIERDQAEFEKERALKLAGD